MNTVIYELKNVTPGSSFSQQLGKNSQPNLDENISEIKLYGLENVSEITITVDPNECTILHFFPDEIAEGSNILSLRNVEAIYTALCLGQPGPTINFVWFESVVGNDTISTPKIEVVYTPNTVPLSSVYDTKYLQYRGTENNTRKFRENILRYSRGFSGSVMAYN